MASPGMTSVRAIRALGPIDVKSITRDPLLRWLMFMPVLMALAMRWGVPVVAHRLRQEYGFAVEPYYVLITSIVALVAPMLAGVVIGFLLLDQRDDGTLAALQVTPLSLGGFLAYRIGVLTVVGVLMTLVAVPLVGLVDVHPLAVLAVAVAASPLAWLYALLLAGFAGNKVQGFALMKAAGVLSWPPVIAYFLSPPWQWAMGLVPQFWPAKLFWVLAAGEDGAALVLVIGIAYQALLAACLLRRFHRVAQR